MLVNLPIYFFVHLCVTLYKGSNKTNVEKFSEFDTFWHKLHRKVRVVLVHNYKEISSRELKHLGDQSGGLIVQGNKLSSGSRRMVQNLKER